MRTEMRSELRAALLRLSLAVLLTMVGALARADAPPASVPLREAIERAIGTPACRTDADCASLGLGERACGGPERYLPYAPAQVKDPARLRALVREHAAARRREQAGRVSHCAMQIDPGARCQAARCVAGEAKTAAPGGLD